MHDDDNQLILRVQQRGLETVASEGSRNVLSEEPETMQALSGENATELTPSVCLVRV